MAKHSLEYKRQWDDSTLETRNVLLADVFYKAGLIESWGRGTLKIVSDCLAQKLPEPQFIEENGVFSVEFSKSSDRVFEGGGEKGGEKITLNQQKILKLMSRNKQVSIVELSQKVGITEKNVENNINRLKKKGLLKRIGSSRGGFWEVLKT